MNRPEFLRRSSERWKLIQDPLFGPLWRASYASPALGTTKLPPKLPPEQAQPATPKDSKVW